MKKKNRCWPQGFILSWVQRKLLPENDGTVLRLMQAYESPARSNSAAAAHFKCNVSSYQQSWFFEACGTVVRAVQYIRKTEQRCGNFIFDRFCRCQGSKVREICVTTSLFTVIMMLASGVTCKVWIWDMLDNNMSLYSFWLDRDICFRHPTGDGVSVVIAIFISMASWHEC